MQHLSLREVIDANRKALADGTLGAVAIADGTINAPFLDRCLYDYGNDVGCAIGIVLNEETLGYIHKHEMNTVGIGVLALSSCVHIDEDELGAFSLIQQAHDSWAKHPEPLTQEIFEIRLNCLEADLDAKEQAADVCCTAQCEEELVLV